MPRKPKNKINVPEPKQLPSGSWRIQLRIGGRSVSITDDDAVTCYARAVAIKSGLIEEKKEERKKAAEKKQTLTEAVDEYIEARSATLSPSTIRGYKIIQKNRFKDIMKLPVESLTKDILQRAVNSEAQGETSAKTIKNSWLFLSSVIHEATGKRFELSLPQVSPNERPFLSSEQIQTFLEAIKGTEIEIPCLLGLWSCRCSEILGLRWQDVDLNKKLIHIRHTRVPDENNKLVAKTATKNAASNRIIPLDARLCALLAAAPRRTEYVCNTRADTLRDRINSLCEKNGLPRIGIHGLRHSFASLGYHLGVPEKVVQEIGGWADNTTMHKIYTHISRSDASRYQGAMMNFFEGKPAATSQPPAAQTAE